MALKWRDAFSCDIKEIDKQHQKLFEIGSRVFFLASLKDDCDHYDEIIEILNELREYTKYHFQYEEKLMQQHTYPEYEKHKFEHDFFIKKLERIERKDLEAKQGDAVMELITFVADWVSSHILKTDMEYKAFFRAKGIQ